MLDNMIWKYKAIVKLRGKTFVVNIESEGRLYTDAKGKIEQTLLAELEFEALVESSNGMDYHPIPLYNTEPKQPI